MRSFLVLLGLMLSVPTPASNLEREQRLANQIQDAIFDGEPLYLNVDGHDFLSIFMQPDDAPKGGVIVLHGRGFHPDWEDVAHPVRVGLTEQGWATLSVQMPVLEKVAKYYEYEPIFPEAVPRIDAAIAFLNEQGIENIVLLAHSCGAHMAMQWVRERGDANISAYVGVGMGATDYKQPMRAPFPLADMSVPVLDIYGADDYPAVHRLAPQRLSMIKQAGHAQSTQQVIPDANHYFTGRGDALTEAVAEWLSALN